MNALQPVVDDDGQRALVRRVLDRQRRVEPVEPLWCRGCGEFIEVD